MLNELRNGEKYQGIIAWAPDRLARNMKEGGEIIDMLDHGDIKDIKFANNFVFNNDPSGKMLLGIAFIMTKQFSDNHSQNVTRAIRNKTSEGKWAGSHLKQGYWKDKLHYLRPDGGNHELIKDVFRLRLEGKQLNEIAAYLRERGYPLQTTHTKHRDIILDDKFVSGVLHDHFYVGAMKFGRQFENLFDKYDFVPAISRNSTSRKVERWASTSTKYSPHAQTPKLRSCRSSSFAGTVASSCLQGLPKNSTIYAAIQRGAKHEVNLHVER
jgi:hypothetical protein